MSTKLQVKDISIGTETVRLFLQGHTRLAEWKQEEFTHLWFLTSKCTALMDPQFIQAFAEISNFFWKGLEFQYILSISDYQSHYRTRVELEKKHPADVFEYRLTDYKIFDVSAMHEPRIEQEQLIYFVYQVNTGLPYRVVCPFPYPLNSTIIHYQILPILEN